MNPINCCQGHSNAPKIALGAAIPLALFLIGALGLGLGGIPPTACYACLGAAPVVLLGIALVGRYSPARMNPTPNRINGTFRTFVRNDPKNNNPWANNIKLFFEIIDQESSHTSSCFYDAVIGQLSSFEQEDLGDSLVDRVHELRNRTANYIATHSNDFLDATNEIGIARDGWAGEAQILAVSKLIDRPLHLYNGEATSHPIENGRTLPDSIYNETATGTPLYLLSGPSHFLTLRPR